MIIGNAPLSQAKFGLCAKGEISITKKSKGKPPLLFLLYTLIFTLSTLFFTLYLYHLLNEHLLTIDDVKPLGWSIGALTIEIINNNLIIGFE